MIPLNLSTSRLLPSNYSDLDAVIFGFELHIDILYHKLTRICPYPASLEMICLTLEQRLHTTKVRSLELTTNPSSSLLVASASIAFVHTAETESNNCT